MLPCFVPLPFSPVPVHGLDGKRGSHVAVRNFITALLTPLALPLLLHFQPRVPSANSQWGGEEVPQCNLQQSEKTQPNQTQKPICFLKQFHYFDVCDLGNRFALWRFSEIRFLFQTQCWLQGSLQRRRIPSPGKLSSFNMQPEPDKAKAGALRWRNKVGGDDDLCLERLNVFFQT